MDKKTAGIGKGTPGPGRGAGNPNKTTALLKDAILKAAENAGKRYGSDGLVSYLETQATDNPGPFLSLLGKVLPLQVNANVDGGLTVVIKRFGNQRPE